MGIEALASVLLIKFASALFLSLFVAHLLLFCRCQSVCSLVHKGKHTHKYTPTTTPS